MKSVTPVQVAAFPDPKLPPSLDAVVATIGPAAYAGVSEVNAWLDSSHRNVTREWKYSAMSGWYEITTLKQRGIFYFIPTNGDFALNIVLGDRAIASLSAAIGAKRTARLLKTARKYAEGTVFSFDARSLDAELVVSVLKAKMAH